ncbi:alpha/beta hydrolase [Gryllotalpicola ginsengisoli]|uniref:alpha/beta hydrolase n=1 Tax=Gryllotalpicola ginsengisoli TaxID=444608 RepID=UPI0003B68451|nr:alpha/beta hydrolase [Gryllotalpicola ginsengisoli]
MSRATGTRHGRGPQRARRLLRAGAVAVAAALLLAGCSLGQQKLPTQTSTPLPAASAPTTSTTPGASASAQAAADAAATRKLYSQALVWTDCSGGFQCAKAKAPLDWEKPSGAQITLALIRKPATGKRLGSLFVNPGGPGESAVDFVRSNVGDMDKTIQEHYDVVGFDPRGVGASTAVSCYDDTEFTKYLYDILPGQRGSTEWLAAARASTAAFGKACLKNTGALLGHIDTWSTAHDLDMLRSDVGDAKVNYFGFSYGTVIGSVYADLFPGNVGRMALDGVTDPAKSYDELVEEQTKGFESNLRSYLEWCLGGSDKTCPFSGSVDSALSRIGQLLQQVDQNPIRNSDGRMLGSTTLVTAIITPLYSQSAWPNLDVLFRDVANGSAKVAFLLADSYNDRSSDGKFSSNLIEAFSAIDCVDYTFDDDLAHMRAEAAKLEQIAPTIGKYQSYGGIACDGWPVRATHPLGPVSAPGAAPILVVGTTNDPATPYQEAVDVSKELESAHLVTYHGNGHTAYGQSNSCVTGTVDDYFVNGTVPAEDPNC